jgi:hypothetical protein
MRELWLRRKSNDGSCCSSVVAAIPPRVVTAILITALLSRLKKLPDYWRGNGLKNGEVIPDRIPYWAWRKPGWSYREFFKAAGCSWDQVYDYVS